MVPWCSHPICIEETSFQQGNQKRKKGKRRLDARVEEVVTNLRQNSVHYYSVLVMGRNVGCWNTQVSLLCVEKGIHIMLCECTLAVLQVLDGMLLGCRSSQEVVKRDQSSSNHVQALTTAFTETAKAMTPTGRASPAPTTCTLASFPGSSPAFCLMRQKAGEEPGNEASVHLLQGFRLAR